MKKVLCILTSMFFLLACEKEETGENLVNVNIGVNARKQMEGELGTRSSPDEQVDWNSHDVRYILEAWIGGKERVLRSVMTAGDMDSPVNFNIRLVPGEYDFLCWADIVPTNSEAGGCYDAEDLRAVKIKEDYVGADVNRDAFAWRERGSFSSDFSLSATLVRPFAKLILANNKTSNSGGEIAVALTFGKGVFMDTYNVMTGEANSSGESSPQPTYPSTKSSDNFLAWDYFFVPASGRMSFKVSVGGGAEKQVDDIPLKRNTITRVIGNFVINN